MDQVWLDIAKYFGLPAAFFIWILWSGHKQIWVWGREKVALMEANAELAADRDKYRDLYVNELTAARVELVTVREKLWQSRELQRSQASGKEATS